MTYVPHGPLWCWILQGEDVMFFSQPTHALWSTNDIRWFEPKDGCVARCQHETRFALEDRPFDLMNPESCMTPPIQCGRVASLDPRGQFLCEYHYTRYWHCHNCDDFMPAGDAGFCSPACREENVLGEGEGP